MLGTNNIWLKDDEKYNPHLISSCSERKISLMIWGSICYDGVGTLTAVEGNINSAKYIDILGKNLWSVVVWYFEGKEYLFMDYNVPVHRAYTVENYKDQNEVTSMEWPAQSPNIWLYMKMRERATKVRRRYHYQKWSSVWNAECAAEHRIGLYKKPLPVHTWPPKYCIIEMKGHLTTY